MADSGLTRFINRGIRFATTKLATTYVGLKTVADPTTSFDITLPSTLPGSTQAVVMTSTGVLQYQSIGGGGSVSSVALALPSDLSQSGGPITTAGTISISRTSQSANVFLGSPDGSAGTPTYRALVSNDIPALLPSKITGFNTEVRTNRLDQFAVPLGNINFNGVQLTGVQSPANNNDVANKLYVDSAVQGVSNRLAVKTASTANINLSAPGTTIDGVTMSTGDRFLAKDQTISSSNGVYVWQAAGVAATRYEFVNTMSGLFVFVQSGTVNGSNGFSLVTPDPIVLGTTNLSFIQTSGAGQIIAGSGMTKTGNSLDVVGTTNRISVASDSIDISSSYVGQTSINTLGIITTGTWNGTALSIDFGGTGATTAAAARTALGATSVFPVSFTNASLTSGVLTITHTLGRQYVSVDIYDDNNKLIPVVDDVTCSSTTSCTIDLTSFGTLTGTWNAVLIG